MHLDRFRFSEFLLLLELNILIFFHLRLIYEYLLLLDFQIGRILRRCFLSGKNLYVRICMTSKLPMGIYKRFVTSLVDRNSYPWNLVHHSLLSWSMLNIDCRTFRTKFWICGALFVLLRLIHLKSIHFSVENGHVHEEMKWKSFFVSSFLVRCVQLSETLHKYEACQLELENARDRIPSRPGLLIFLFFLKSLVTGNVHRCINFFE